MRYQPVPEIGSAPVCGFCWGSKGPAIAQSWGKRNATHEESSKAGFSAPTASPLKNRHPRLKLTGRWPETSTAVGGSGCAQRRDEQKGETNRGDERTAEASFRDHGCSRHGCSVMDAPLRLSHCCCYAVYCLHHHRFLVILLREDWLSFEPGTVPTGCSSRPGGIAYHIRFFRILAIHRWRCIPWRPVRKGVDYSPYG